MIQCKFENGNQASLRHVVIDALVLKDNKILLVKRAGKLLESGKWGLVGGFVERDETLGQAVSREVFEETGWKVKDITLLKINDSPNRPKEDRQNFAFVYICNAARKEGNADSESDEQKWFELDQIPSKKEIAFDHFDNIELFKKHIIENLALPILGST